MMHFSNRRCSYEASPKALSCMYVHTCTDSMATKGMDLVISETIYNIIIFICYVSLCSGYVNNQFLSKSAPGELFAGFWVMEYGGFLLIRSFMQRFGLKIGWYPVLSLGVS